MEPPKLIGRYEILGELGRGAMGTVYRAKDPAMDRIVALKTIISVVLASDQGGDFRERFYREARAAGALSHPGIVAVYDVGEHEGQPFLVMEFIDGRTLADALKKGERMTLDRICEIGQKIAEALSYAHLRGVVHRDIKPANILLTSRQAHGIERPKITDFGVAKLSTGQTTMTGQILGTPAFMPPEQFTGAPLDGRADIFSLGVILYWMATGEQPFPGESMTAVSYKVVHTEPPPPRKLNPSIPAKLETIIMKCLEKSPEDRYQSGDELARDLGELRSGKSAGAPSIPAGSPDDSVVLGGTGIDPDATIVEALPPMRTPTTQTAQRTRPVPRTVATVATPAPASADKPKTGMLLAVAAVAVAVAVGGWFALRHKAAPPAVEQTAVVPTTSATPSAAATLPAASPASAAPAQPLAATAEPAAAKAPAVPRIDKKAAAIAAKKIASPAAAPVAAAPIAPAPAPEPAAVDFDPKSLNPKENAPLIIEAEGVPSDLNFTVELNGKVYFRRTAAGQVHYEGLYIPPGVQELRVSARSGAVQKVSNIVSTEFKAKKKHTLEIELRVQGMPPGSGTPQGLYPDTQLVATLK